MGKLKKVYKIMVYDKSIVLNANPADYNNYEGEEDEINYFRLFHDCNDVFDTPEAAEVELLKLLEWYDAHNSNEVKLEYSIMPFYTFEK